MSRSNAADTNDIGAKAELLDLLMSATQDGIVDWNLQSGEVTYNARWKHLLGFDSAVACATDALDRLHTTAAAHDRVMVLEVMGRHAGWIALHAGIAGGGDVIL